MTVDSLATGWVKALSVDRKQFNLFFDKMMDGFAYHRIVVNKKGEPIDYIFLEVNVAFERMTGLRKEKILGKKVTEVLPGIEKDSADWIGVYGKVALTGRPVQFENHAEVLGKWYNVSAYCPEKGYFVALFEDITEQKNVENTLRATLDRFYNSLSKMHGAILLVSSDGLVEFANQSFCDYFHLKESPEDLKKLSSEKIIEKIKNDYLHPDQQLERIKEILASGKIVTDEEVEMQGNRTCLRDFIPIYDEGKSFTRLWHHIDITERKKAEEELKASEKKANDLIKYAPSGIYELDYRIPPKFRSVNDAMCQILGYSREELLAMNPFALLDDESKVRFQERIKKMLAGEKVDETVEFKVMRKDGREIFAVMNVQFTYRDGKPDGALVVAHDITERKKAEIALVEWAENLEIIVNERTKELELASSYTRSLIEASLDPLVTISSEGKITDVNIATENVTGCTRDELIGSDFSDFFSEPDKARAGYLRVFTEGYVKDYPLSIRHKSGRLTDVLYNASIYRNTPGEIQGVFAAARDITERKQAEQKLKDAERLANIGATAGMVGHDIRNPLQAITSDVYLVKTELSSTPESEEKNNIKESLTEIEKNIDYINKIVQDLQDYARPLNPKIEENDLGQIVESLFAKNGLPENIEVRFEVVEGTNKVRLDAYYLNRILFNLVTNAVQAMPQGGKLTVKAYKEENDTVITVSDTGVGIPKEIQSKIFTLMFTTKSKGQGFGLPVVKRMTESLGGTVTFESQEGKGTTFTVRFPQSPQQKT